MQTPSNANTAYYDKAVDRAALIRLYEKRLEDKIFVVLDDHKVRVDDLIRNASLSVEGFKRLFRAVDDELQTTFKAAYQVSKTNLLDLAVDEMSFAYQNFETTVGEIWKTNRPTRRIAEEFVLEKPLIQNQTLAQGWAGVSMSERKRIEAIIRHGISEGRTVEQIALTIRSGNLHKITKNQSKALVTTAITSVNAQADHAVYKANEKALQGWEYVAVLDSRTTPICTHRDGQVFGIDETRYLPPAHYRCYVEGTEILTLEGFKDFRDVELGEFCLSLDPKTEDLSWQPVIRLIKRENEDVVNLVSKTVNMSVSVDHPFIGQKRVDKGQYKEYQYRKYESIFDIPNLGDFRMFASSKWQGASPDHIKLGSKEVSIETYCKFMAWWLSDGSVSKKNKGYLDVKITQKTHLAYMYNELKEMNPTLRQTELGFLDQKLGQYLLQFGKCDEKFIPFEIKDLDKEELLVFLNAYLLADGCSSKLNDFEGYDSNLVRSFFTTSYKLASDLVECVIKVGDSASIVEQAPRSYADPNGKEYHSKKITYKIAWNRSQYRRLSDCKITFESGKTVYDVELADKHTLLTKYKGKIIWGSNCRSTTIPVFKSWEQMSELEGVAEVRRRNLKNLTPEQIAFYDGQTPLKESYSQWLYRQPEDVQLRHLGDYTRVKLFNTGQLTVDKFTTAEGNSVGLNDLRQMTDDTPKFAFAKQKLDAMQLGITSPDDLIDSKKLQKTLKDYYILQANDLEGNLSLTNYRGQLLHTKRQNKRNVLARLPTEEQIKFNPITGRYEDVRLYQPNPGVYENALRLIREAPELKQADKDFILNFVEGLTGSIGVNQQSVVADNLRILFTRYRKNPQVWGNFKALNQAQMKYDIVNISEAIETSIRKDSDVLKKLQMSNYIDPVLGPTQLQEIHDEFIDNIIKKNRWEDSVAPKIARELRSYWTTYDTFLPFAIKLRLTEGDLQKFFLKFAQRLALADGPDFDSVAAGLGRDLYNLASVRGNRNDWVNLGKKILEKNNKFYELETFGVQKRRMKSRMSGQYFQ